MLIWVKFLSSDLSITQDYLTWETKITKYIKSSIVFHLFPYLQLICKLHSMAWLGMHFWRKLHIRRWTNSVPKNPESILCLLIFKAPDNNLITWLPDPSLPSATSLHLNPAFPFINLFSNYGPVHSHFLAYLTFQNDY